MPYQIFTRKTARTGVPSVTLNSYGRMQFNKCATAKFEKEVVEYILLLWDEESRKVGVRAISKKDPRAYKISYGTGGNGVGFSTKTFFDFIKLDYSESRSIPVEMGDGDILMEFQIPEELILKKGQPSLIKGSTKGEKMA